MNAASLSVTQVALRHSRRYFLWPLSAPHLASASYHSYPLPTSTSTSLPQHDITERPIVQPEAPPRTHKTLSSFKHTRAAPGTTSTLTPPSKSIEAATPSSTPKADTRLRPKLRPRKAAMKLTPAAVEQLRTLLDQPEPKLIKVGVRNRGCSGLAYHLEYVDQPGAFDETVEQDGVKVLIDSRALFSILGSEMDWAEDKLNQRFVFKNPNIKEQCGCGESFMV
ncbi:iron sulfur assembly protein 1 [Drechmeria coniospora]|uniref:Iron-sulfur assembly protein 1 n=1 Tax=Drechmeria coniospora TaxID=98403 RepID=A0A151GFL0_DRECN|nr:iron sulfur assembly protein 1 [Drechmeria coniospora]KYK55878.1 iron sulfur assembly protein 1 [Drechmeria coniospora]